MCVFFRKKEKRDRQREREKDNPLEEAFPEICRKLWLLFLLIFELIGFNDNFLKVTKRRKTKRKNNKTLSDSFWVVSGNVYGYTYKALLDLILFHALYHRLVKQILLRL